MHQSENRIFLIKELLKEKQEYGDIRIPAGTQEQKRYCADL